MKASFVNELSASFMLFLDHEVCSKGDAFVNIQSGTLYPSSDPYFNNYTVYQSQYRQWVADSSIHDATICSGVNISGSFYPKGASGMKVDYGMGRLIFDNAVPASISNIKTNFATKEFNLFLTAKDETQLFLNDPVSSNAITGALPNSLEPYPLVYVKNFFGENEPFAFGGLDESNHEFRCTIFSDTAFKLDSLNSILQDSARKSFSLIPPSGIPFDVFGDFKSVINGYNYINLSRQYSNNLVYIESVRISKFDERVNKLIKEGVWGGFADFKLKTIRMPRA
jgi:hypothetical protein